MLVWEKTFVNSKKEKKEKKRANLFSRDKYIDSFTGTDKELCIEKEQVNAV